MIFSDLISQTLYVPLLGRIYASQNYPHIFHDPQALALEKKLPREVLSMPGQNQYTLLASVLFGGNGSIITSGIFSGKTENL